MHINYECLPCLVNQAVKVAEISKAKDRDVLLRKVFSYLGDVDFSKTNPEIIGNTFRILKEHIGNEDPYKETRRYYNQMFLKMERVFEDKINCSKDSLQAAVVYAIVGNIIDFNPVHTSSVEDILKWFSDVAKLTLKINHVEKMIYDLKKANILLYLGDNCGEICLDKLLIKKIKECNPKLKIYFGVRGEPVVNDSIAEDAYFVGIDEYASVISNGDNSLGTVLERTSKEFRQVFNNADVVISKGQANYESLSECSHKNIYYLLMTKCGVIAKMIGVEEKSLICMNVKPDIKKEI